MATPGTPAHLAYLLFVGRYEKRNVVGVYSTITRACQAITERALRGDSVEAIGIELEGVDGAEPPAAAVDELARFLDVLRTAPAVQRPAAYRCPCGAPQGAHCQTCFHCPGGHEDLCGWTS